MNCSWVHENLSDILDGLLTPDAVEELNSHLKECSACSELLIELKDDKLLLEDLGDVVVPPFLAERVMLEIKLKPAKNAWKFFVPRLAPVAAALLVTVASINVLPGVLEKRELAKGTEVPEFGQQRMMTASDATSGTNAEHSIKSFQANEVEDKKENVFTDTTVLSLGIAEKPSVWVRTSVAGGTAFVLWGAIVYYWYKKQ